MGGDCGIIVWALHTLLVELVVLATLTDITMDRWEVLLSLYKFPTCLRFSKLSSPEVFDDSFVESH
jgi:hypothetical protein